MYKIPLADLKNIILESKKITPRDLEEKIKLKINELSGLISEEGAAHIIANELSISVVRAVNSKLKIKEIYAGMRNLVTVGKVLRKFDVREFAKGESTGKVCSVVLGDETGTIRVVFWNDQVARLDKVQEGDILLLKDVYAKENNASKEIHVGERTEITINPEGETIAQVRQSSNFQRSKISELTEGSEGTEILGTIVQIFDPRFFYVCPNCSKRANETEGQFQCAEHGTVQPVVSYVLNVILDDGTGTIRSTFWKNQTNHLLGKDEQEILRYKDNVALFEDMKTELLGEQLKVMGRIKKNDLFDRLELNVQLVEKANPEEELARLEQK